VSIEGSIHLPFVAVIGSDEIRAYEQEDGIRHIEMAVDGFAKLCSSHNTTIMPGRDYSLPLKGREMLFELIAKALVSVGV
jgi:hypothetical protein